MSAPSPASRRLTQIAARLRGFDQVLVDTIGTEIVDALEDQVARDTGGDSALSGMAGGRYRLTLKVSPLNNPAGVRIRPAAKQTGMWTIVNSGRRGGYTVGARPKRRHKTKGRKGRRYTSRDQAMAIGGAWRAGPYTVRRSTRGRGTWAKGRDTGWERGLDAARRELHELVTG